MALIDSGVQADITDLQGVVLPGIAYSETGTQARGDGRVDSDSELGGHGTAMATLIAGQGRGSRMMGVAPESRILPIQASSQYNYPEAIRYAVDHGAKVINFSEGVGYRCTDSIQDAVSYAISNDVVIVAASGNDPREPDTAPGDCAGVLSVGALSHDLKIWEKSAPGRNVMVAGPGVSVGATMKDGRFRPNLNGTSQAAALSSGVIALMRSHYSAMSGREVVQRLVATAKDVGPKGWDKWTGNGAMIPYLALTAEVPHNARNPAYEKLDTLQGMAPDVPKTESPAQHTRAVANEKVQGGGSSTGLLLGIAGSVVGLAVIAFAARRIMGRTR
nr:type VII secretion-associated serine protease mycosin [Actinomadura rugatobispora]